MSNIDLMGKQIYELIYKHCDSKGHLIDDYEEVLYCEDKYISSDRVEELKLLLNPVSNAKESLIPLEAAKLLAAWGAPEAIDYFEYCIDNRIDKLGNLSPHRLYGYDTVYEEISDAIINYYARHADRSVEDGKGASIYIRPLLKKIIQLTKELPYSLLGIIKILKRKEWREYESDLKDCFVEFVNKSESGTINDQNIHDLKALLMEWDPDFVNKIKV